ncbi:MAG: hypothetical protein LUG50_08375, partial [Planctomycetaceae bacterium]|nr:hypothetical protein [Planctomycetaceae bacterium]
PGHGPVGGLRAAGYSADMDYDGRSMKSQLRTANKREAMCCLILGEEELERGEIVVKDMGENGVQQSVSLFDCMDAVKKVLTWGA